MRQTRELAALDPSFQSDIHPPSQRTCSLGPCNPRTTRASPPALLPCWISVDSHQRALRHLCICRECCLQRYCRSGGPLQSVTYAIERINRTWCTLFVLSVQSLLLLPPVCIKRFATGSIRGFLFRDWYVELTNVDDYFTQNIRVRTSKSGRNLTTHTTCCTQHMHHA